MINKFKNSKGITLIALVITIIVLLILAGVAISMLSGENGILKQAAKAKTETERQSTLEQIRLASLSAMTNPEHKVTAGDLSTELGKYGYSLENPSATDNWTVTKDGMTYTITSNGEVDEMAVVNVAPTTAVTIKTKYIDSSSTKSGNNEVIIPKGFYVKEGLDKIDEGVVVVAPDESEFVWVPVADAIYDGTTEIEVGTYTPMARLQNGTTNYQGILYDLNKASGSQSVYNFTNYGVGTTKYREPSLVTGSNEDTYAEMGAVKGTSYDNGNNTSVTPNKPYYEYAGYSSIQEFGKDMQKEYNNMVKSVSKYKGFYVGRYETGIEGGKAVSKNAYINETVTTADASQDATKYWYGLYNKQRTMATDNNFEEVKSSMIWGSQYDAMMNWMIDTENIVGTGYDSSKWTSGITITGQSEKDIINQIHDLYGCHYEWTLEANNTLSRVNRGGYYNGSNAPSGRLNVNPDGPYDGNGSRLTLYVK